MDKAKDAEAQLKEILRSYNPTSPWLYGPSTRLKAWVMMLFIPRAAAPLKGLRIVANISLLSCLITKDRLKTQPHKQTQTPYLMPDPYIPSLPSILLGCLRSNSSTTWKKPSSSSSPLWWASSLVLHLENDTVIRTVSRNVDILCDPLLSLTYDVQ